MTTSILLYDLLISLILVHHQCYYGIIIHSHTYNHIQRYTPVIASGNLNVNMSLVEEVQETFRLIDWRETVRVLGRVGVKTGRNYLYLYKFC